MRVWSLVLPIAAAMGLLVAACGGKSGSAEMRSPGEQAFRASCQTCHVLPKPSMQTDEAWPGLVARYGERARLSEEQIAAITAYLVANND